MADNAQTIASVKSGAGWGWGDGDGGLRDSSDSCPWEVYSLVGVTDTGGISVERGNFSDVGASRAL